MVEVYVATRWSRDRRCSGNPLSSSVRENTRERISTKTRNGMEAVNSKIRQTGQQVGDWIDESKQQVREAVDAGRDAFSKARSGAT